MLGEGAFAVVYRAVHRISGQEVAIKMVSVHLLYPQLLKYFLLEMRFRMLKSVIFVVYMNYEHQLSCNVLQGV